MDAVPFDDELPNFIPSKSIPKISDEISEISEISENSKVPSIVPMVSIVPNVPMVQLVPKMDPLLAPWVPLVPKREQFEKYQDHEEIKVRKEEKRATEIGIIYEEISLLDSFHEEIISTKNEYDFPPLFDDKFPFPSFNSNLILKSIANNTQTTNPYPTPKKCQELLLNSDIYLNNFNFNVDFDNYKNNQAELNEPNDIKDINYLKNFNLNLNVNLKNLKNFKNTKNMKEGLKNSEKKIIKLNVDQQKANVNSTLVLKQKLEDHKQLQVYLLSSKKNKVSNVPNITKISKQKIHDMKRNQSQKSFYNNCNNKKLKNPLNAINAVNEIHGMNFINSPNAMNATNEINKKSVGKTLKNIKALINLYKKNKPSKLPLISSKNNKSNISIKLLTAFFKKKNIVSTSKRNQEDNISSTKISDLLRGNLNLYSTFTKLDNDSSPNFQQADAVSHFQVSKKLLNNNYVENENPVCK